MSSKERIEIVIRFNGSECRLELPYDYEELNRLTVSDLLDRCRSAAMDGVAVQVLDYRVYRTD